MLRGLLYGSYRKPRELVWIFGVAIFLCLMAEAFFGYLLPWGQMSYWGAQVIVNLFAAIPFIGPELSIWIRGDYVVSDATLNRFFAFHVIAIPLVLVGLVAAHLVALHEVGSNNPDGIEIKQGPKDKYGRPKDGIPFHPFYSVHDLMGVAGFLLVFAFIVFFAPEMGGYFLEFNNFIPADSLKTPPHIAPVWYFTPFYSMLRATTDEFTWVLAGAAVLGAIALLVKSNLKGIMRVAIPGILIVVAVLLRAIDAKFWGVVAMGGTVVILFFLPWLDHSPVKSIRYRPTWHKWIYGIFMVNFLVLGYIGTQPPSPPLNITSQIGTLLYLAFFFLMPVWSRLGTFKKVPERVTFHAH
jgi:ubiquinol-cytochrome c reductase cytochrome b subunit